MISKRGLVLPLEGVSRTASPGSLHYGSVFLQSSPCPRVFCPFWTVNSKVWAHLNPLPPSTLEHRPLPGSLKFLDPGNFLRQLISQLKLICKFQGLPLRRHILTWKAKWGLFCLATSCSSSSRLVHFQSGCLHFIQELIPWSNFTSMSPLQWASPALPC